MIKFFRRRRHEPDLSPEEQEAAAALALEQDPDMGLLTDFVTRQLDAAGNAAVLDRLATDPAFRDLAAPVLFAASVARREDEGSGEESPDKPLDPDRWVKIRRDLGHPPFGRGAAADSLDVTIGREYGDRVRGRMRARRRRLRETVLVTAVVFAAAVGLPIGLTFMNRPPAPNVYAPPANESVVATLGDGTIAAVQGGSTLSHAPGFESELTRTVSLDGGTTFTVAHQPGSGFVVRTRTAVVTATGTVFTVRCFSTDSETTVTVAEGTVVARPIAGGVPIVLHAGERGTIRRDSATRFPTTSTSQAR